MLYSNSNFYAIFLLSFWQKNLHFFFQIGSPIHKLRRCCGHRRRFSWKSWGFNRHFTQNAPIRTQLQTQGFRTRIPIALQLPPQWYTFRSGNSFRFVRRKVGSVDRSQMRRKSRGHFCGGQKERSRNCRIHLWTLLCKF